MSASDSDDDFHDDEFSEAEADVELGFVKRVDEPVDAKLLHDRADWNNWDGGLVGGQPRWLNPIKLPTTDDLACDECRSPLSFLLQIYCPLDENADAFHRSLYVFCCRKRGCSHLGRGKAFRIQLPRVNCFYDDNGDSEIAPTRAPSAPPLCALCGQRASFKCNACKVAQYCCKEHQKDHWSHGHKGDCANCGSSEVLAQSEDSLLCLRTQGSTWLFPQYEVEIESEPNVGGAANEHEAKLIAEFENRKAEAATAGGSSDENDPFADDADFSVTQRELNEALGTTADQDKQYVRFLTRVELAKDQVLRYARWQPESVLWVHSDATIAPDQVPKCDRCGSERKFEFQILPQLLFYLQVDQSSSLAEIADKSCEWGTLAVFTCTKSCASNGEPTQEFLHYQAPYSGA